MVFKHVEKVQGFNCMFTIAILIFLSPLQGALHFVYSNIVSLGCMHLSSCMAISSYEKELQMFQAVLSPEV